MYARRHAVAAVLVIGCAASTAACIAGGGAVLTVGASVPLTGSLAQEGLLTKEGYQLCVEKVNARGGIIVGGQTMTLQVKYADDASKPAEAARLVDEFHKQGIKFIFGSYGSANTAAQAPVVERNGQLLMDSAGADNAIFTKGYKRIFAVQSPASRYVSAIVKAIDDLASPTPATIAFVSADDGFSKTATASGVVTARALGLRVVGIATVPSGTTDVRAALAKIKNLNPEIVVGSVHMAEGLALVRQSRELGLHMTALGETVAPPSPDFAKTLGAAAEGVLGSSQWTIAVGGRDDVFGDATAYDQAVRAAYHHAADYHNAEASAACLTLALGLEKAGSDSPAAVAQALGQLDATSFFGPLHFDSTGKNMTKEMVVIQVQKGRSVTVWPPGEAEARLVWPGVAA